MEAILPVSAAGFSLSVLLAAFEALRHRDVWMIFATARFPSWRINLGRALRWLYLRDRYGAYQWTSLQPSPSPRVARILHLTRKLY